ncbi:Adapter molecule Crk [Eumeta japonica]|uniref:Adapter molecule Crk n=1 Tax=Eumeta variegata TaxID=151549 RepID=A0A4C1UYJ6_EUMVA|nr:Adapter molecule Crk [Eumeta japonica]
MMSENSLWYFGGMSRAEATRLLLNETESGVFLVRDSNTIHGDYVLCVRSAIDEATCRGTTEREDGRVSHYIINRIVSADGTTRYRIGDQLFADMPALLAFYRLHYLDTTPLVRPLPQKPKTPAQPQQHQVLELVIAKFDFDGSDADDLPFRRGERLMVINRDEEQWWTARNAHGRTGSIPVPYVHRILDPSGAPYPPAEALAQLSNGPPSPPPGAHAHAPKSSMQRQLPALARVRQTRVPNAYDKTALKLQEGDILTVTKMNINGQWEGELNGKVGHFPFTYVEFIDDNVTS